MKAMLSRGRLPAVVRRRLSGHLSARMVDALACSNPLDRSPVSIFKQPAFEQRLPGERGVEAVNRQRQKKTDTQHKISGVPSR